jgi:beta-lactamase regulating signal transducer with metallopeptidase domain/Flp pilus assembly secretin CpaC
VNPLLRWLTSPEWAHVVGALLHSLWLGAIVALALAVLMRRLTNPLTRYRCALSALGVIGIAGLVTWAVLNAPNSAPHPITAKAIEPTAPTITADVFDSNPTDKVVVIGQMTRPEAPTNWTAWLALTWMAGAMVMLLRAGVKVAGAEKLRRSCQPLADEPIAALVAEACRAVGLACKIRVAVTDKLTSPAVVGVLVPTLILPLSLFTTLTPTQIQFVLLHELAHIRRGDYLTNLFQLFAEALLFFNPAVWWISHQVRREREACCDALAIELSGAPADYARTLVRVAENILQPAPAAAPAFGDDGREPSSLADRVQRLVVPGYRPALRLTWRAILSSLIVGGTLLVLSAIGTRNTVGAILTSSQPTTSPVLLGPGINPDVQARASGDDSNIQTTLIPTLTEFVGYDLGTAAAFVPTALNNNFRISTNATDRVPFLSDIPILGKLFTSESSATRYRTGEMNAAAINIQPGTMVLAGTLPLPLVKNNHSNNTDSRANTTSKNSLAHSAPSPVVEIHGGRVVADVNTGIMTATNGARAKFANQELSVDYIEFNSKRQELSAQGNVRLETNTGTFSGEDLHFPLPSDGNSPPSQDWFRNWTTNAVTASAATATNNFREPLFTRSFNLTPEVLYGTIITNLVPSALSGSATGVKGEDVQTASAGFRTWFRRLGIDLDPQLGKSVFYSNRGGLFVRATKTELDTIEDAVMKLNASSIELTTRTYQVETTTIAKAIEAAVPEFKSGATTNITAGLRALFLSAGVDLTLPKSIFYNDRAGGLFVRATKKDLDTIESLLRVIGQQPAQVNIKTVFVELPFGKDQPKALAKILEPITPENGATFTGILTAAQFKLILRTLETNSAAKILASPQITTTSGQQAQIQIADVKTIISGMTAVVTNGMTNLVYQSEAMSFGPVLDILPTVSNDGYTMHMTLSPTFTEFLGYEDAKKLKLSPPDDKATLPLPILRKRQMTTSASVWDGQTIVLGNFSDQMLDTPPDLKGTPKTSGKKQSKQLLVFVTPTIIDPAGNPANKDMGIPSSLNSFGTDPVPKAR